VLWHQYFDKHKLKKLEWFMDKALPLALTFDDVLLKPGYSNFAREDIDLSTQLTKKIKLKLPLVAAPMDTVTEKSLAIALGQLGGIGFIHRNLTIAEQAKQVAAIKAKGLLVGAAVGSSNGYEARVEQLVAARTDVILIDCAHGYAAKVVKALKYIKSHYKVEVIAGNVATLEGAKALIEAGADGLRVGMGPGAICSTRIISGMGVPQLSAILETAKVAKKFDVPVMADGGINYSGDIVKALAAGASSVMMGRLLAATREAPGKIVQLKAAEVPKRFRSIVGSAKAYGFRQYRGMGSIGAMQQGLKISSEEEFHGKNFQGDVLIAEGVEGLVPCSGSVADLVAQLSGGLYSGLYYVGARNIKQLWRLAKFMQITPASLQESHPHDLFITNGGGNY
jgi:IMP dehydrogenase